MIESFREILDKEKEKEYFKKLTQYIDSEYSSKTIFPPRDSVMNSMKYTPYKHVKVVVVGQDPYHGEGEAHGLSFSVNPGIPIPPSLKNIYKELNRDLGLYIPNNRISFKMGKTRSFVIK